MADGLEKNNILLLIQEMLPSGGANKVLVYSTMIYIPIYIVFNTL